MAKNKKICITFAGAVGSSKTPISNFLSTKLNLPIFNNDAIRTEIVENFRIFNPEEYLKLRNARLKDILESGVSFICDVSVDREWKEFKRKLIANDYRWYIISLDLSKDFLSELYRAKEYFDSLRRINALVQDHNGFLNENSSDVNLHIADKDFKKRCQLCLKNSADWMKNIS